MTYTTPQVTPMRPLMVPQRGSGPVACCGGHLERCHFGRQHTWSTWYEDGKLQRTRLTFHCLDCGGVCTAEEGACSVCGALEARDEVNGEPTCGSCAATLRIEANETALDQIAALLRALPEDSETFPRKVFEIVRGTGRACI